MHTDFFTVHKHCRLVTKYPKGKFVLLNGLSKSFQTYLIFYYVITFSISISIFFCLLNWYTHLPRIHNHHLMRKTTTFDKSSSIVILLNNKNNLLFPASRICTNRFDRCVSNYISIFINKYLF